MSADLRLYPRIYERGQHEWLKKKATPEKAEKKKKRKKRLITAVIAIACWAAFGLIMRLLFGSGEKEAFTVEIFAETVHVGPIAVSSCSLWGLGISGVLIVTCHIVQNILRSKV